MIHSPIAAQLPAHQEMRDVRPVFRLETYQSIQALRGFAAVMVTIFHAGLRFDPAQTTFRVGNAGVDVFFVISGFVMWMVTSRRSTTPVVFLKHRFVRLVPMYWLVTLAMVVAAVIIPSAFPRTHPTLSELVLSLAFLPHVSSATGSIEPVLGQGWTLNFEVFFYLIFAVSLLLPIRTRLAAIAVSLVALSVAGAFIVTSAIPVATLLSPLLLEFLGGIGIAWLARGAWRPNALSCWMAVVAGCVLLAMSGPAAGDDPARTVQYGIPACLIVGGAVGLESAGRIVVSHWLRLLGAASYSIYLVHPFAISLLGKVWPVYLPPWIFLAAATLFAVLLGTAVYIVVEMPLLAIIRGRRLPNVATTLPAT